MAILVRELGFRTAHANDSEFVFSVKKAAFQEYVEGVWGWDDSYQRELHNRRFAAQVFWIVHLHDADVGFLAMSRASNVVKVNQLFILPEYQGHEIGSACMPRIVDEARLARKSVILQVLKVNPRGLRFYQRLGFTIVGDSATHYQMESP